MAVLGLILLVGVVVVTAAVVSSNTGTTDVSLWGLTVSNLSLGTLFIAGMITTIIGLVAVALVLGGTRRARRMRRERRRLTRENERLVQRTGALDDTAPAGEPAPGTAPPPTSPHVSPPYPRSMPADVEPGEPT